MDRELIKKRRYVERQKTAPWLQNKEKRVTITLIGVGTIGSWTSLALSRVFSGREKHNMVLIDKDIVEDINLAGQCYSIYDISRTKVAAMQKRIKKESPLCEVNIIEDNYSEDYKIIKEENDVSIVIVGTDSMESRKQIVESLTPESYDLIVDGRLSPEIMEVITIRNEEQRAYYLENYIYSKEELEEPLCSFKSTSHTGMMIGGIITNIVTNFVTNVDNDIEITTIPEKLNVNFKTMEYDLR